MEEVLTPRATGSIPANLHEGNRSEYLALYVFTMFGTAVQVPRPEDFGVDLYCTLFSEREDGRVWPEAYYAVQVKSDENPLVFPHRRSVQWIVEYPAPFLLCIVTKKEGLVRIYQTFARFGATVAQDLPESLTLIPEGRPPGSMGPYGYDEATGQYQLGVPILSFRIEELLDEDRFQKIRLVLRYWILKDFDNVRRYQMGMRSLWVPWEVRTNDVPAGPDSILSLYAASPEARKKAEESLSLLLDWLVGPWSKDSNHVDAMLAAILLRSRGLTPPSSIGAIYNLRQAAAIDAALGTDPNRNGEDILDALLGLLKNRLGA